MEEAIGVNDLPYVVAVAYCQADECSESRHTVACFARRNRVVETTWLAVITPRTSLEDVLPLIEHAVPEHGSSA
jgi:hypothetical protein